MTNATIARLFPLAAFLAIGCSALETRWYIVAPPMAPVWVQVPVEQLRAVCWESATALRNRGCVVRRFDTRTCFIFATAPREDFSPEDIAHEEQKHCREGLNHD